ncbi:hypothetical protein GCM10009861_02370 [Neomicrococcus aestuarii]
MLLKSSLGQTPVASDIAATSVAVNLESVTSKEVALSSFGVVLNTSIGDTSPPRVGDIPKAYFAALSFRTLFR